MSLMINASENNIWGPDLEKNLLVLDVAKKVVTELKLIILVIEGWRQGQLEQTHKSYNKPQEPFEDLMSILLAVIKRTKELDHVQALELERYSSA